MVLEGGSEGAAGDDTPLAVPGPHLAGAIEALARAAGLV